MPTLPLLLLLAALPAGIRPAAGPHAADPNAAGPATLTANDDQRESLEDLLRRLREKRAGAEAGLTAKIDHLLATLDTLGPRPRPDAWHPIQTGLTDLGPEAAPLLVAHLDPGSAPSASDRLRAHIMAKVLALLPTPATTEPLLYLAENGSPQGRVLALGALGTTTETKRVTGSVTALYHSTKDPVRTAALTTLATIGGPENEELLKNCLAGSERAVVSEALVALAASGNEAVEPRVFLLVRPPHRAAAEHVREIIAYYRAVPHLARGNRITELVGLAADVDLSSSLRVALLEALPDFEPKLDSNLKKALAPLCESAVGSVREAALVCRTLLGDKRAGRELLEPYKKQVDRNQGESRPLLERAEVNSRIKEYGEAVKDYKKALLCNDFYRRDSGETKVELARCYCLMGRLKDASKWLSDASISLKRLAGLEQDPDFATLRDHRLYGNLLWAR
jgi:hypothetical protein